MRLIYMRLILKGTLNNPILGIVQDTKRRSRFPLYFVFRR